MDFKAISQKWQEKWEKERIFETQKETNKKKYYILEMFPYPSASGLHMGHACNYIIGDIYARFKRMNNYNVLYPMGYDSLGLPAENAAIKEGIHPKQYTEKAIQNFIRQQKELGLSYDWTRVIKTSDSNYYKWDQWIFLKMLEKQIAFRKKAPVNWCPDCQTVLANEQVHNGKCWRHTNTDVQIKHLEQWFLKITSYADEIYEKTDTLKNWPDDVKAMQKHWIGKSHGTEILFEINGKKWPVFTTRPDTIYGVTFMVISAQHPQLMSIVTEKQKKEVQEFLNKIKTTSEKDMEELEKEGAFTGSYAINPINQEKVPVYTGNFVIAEYGSGMVMAVPAHDQRDFEFAKKYQIPIKTVIQPDAYELRPEKTARAYTDEGNLVNSGKFNGINNKEAIKEITNHLEQQKLGKKTIQYKLRDWLISRQRYWGTPIPIIYCPKCGIVPVSEKDLPVKLPENVQFGEGNPLKTSKQFINTACPICKGKAKRETDTMDTFVNSSWYFLRYCDPKNKEKIFQKEKASYWMPIDLYIGGKEHACMHLIYFRFYTKFLRDIGLLRIDEPTQNLFNQGMLHGEDGAVMSKSRGNVILPEKISQTYGIDTARLFLMFIASPDKDREWSEKGIQSSLKAINKVITLCEKKPSKTANPLAESKMHNIIQKVTQKINQLEYNRAIIDIMEYIRFLEKQKTITRENQKNLLLLISPFCPHIAEELWEKIGEKPFISIAQWPKANPDKIDPKIESAEQTVHNIISDIHQVKKLTNIDSPKKIILYIAQPWKYQFVNKLKQTMNQTRKMPEIIKQILTKELKPRAKEITKMIPKYLKDPSKLPEQETDRKTELEAIEHAHQTMEQEFKAPIQVIKEEETKENKAKHAMPGKPAILIE